MPGVGEFAGRRSVGQDEVMSMPTTPSSRGASGGGVVPDGAHRATAASAAPTTRVPTGPYAPARSHGFVGASASSAPRASATSAASAPRAATAPRRTGSETGRAHV